MHPHRKRHRETPERRVNPSGAVVWMARYTDQHGRRRRAGTFKLKGPCRTPVDGEWFGEKWAGCCAQHAIDAAYDREAAPRPARTDTMGGYARLWPKIHPRSERTNRENQWRLKTAMAIKVEGVALRDWPISEVKRRHARIVQAALLEQGRAAEGASGILRALSAMTEDAIDDELCEDSNPWLRLGVRRSDPRVQKPPRPKLIWSMEDMHAFAQAAAVVRDEERDEPTGLEQWRAIYAQPMIRVLSDCGLRLGELPPLERRDLSPGWLHVGRTAHQGQVQDGTKTTHDADEEHQGRDIPLPSSLEAMLRALPARLDPPLLFATPTGLVWRERNWRRDIWQPAIQATGMQATPQQFRASWESIMRAAGVDPADLAKYAGHSVATANARYVGPLNRSAQAVRDVIG